MKLLRKLISPLVDKNTNPDFLVFVDKVEDFFAKLLTLAMLGVILFAIIDLGVTLAKELLLVSELGNFSAGLLKIFGLFLNILIALEITQNITSYLSSHIIQIEMVIVTSLIAVARKIIILDLGKITDSQLLALATAIIALSICYWLVRRTNAKYPPHKGH
ncbi:phosphate-starvation-inducible PsiE family protein [Scytonema millei]|uniref:Phosphate-starvation-inducible PsiE family protein n=1 Tax=Scytonema millei VB511283 TaxID=1245923 RepID=A0A9X5E751_9CYAN|nr:phosphate-starvation-inducible PsiE family protein [Scytonema millei]NHC36536.1 phosphate-starvation-inducible PsiE family protein [Scytonema millei VB511283]